MAQGETVDVGITDLSGDWTVAIRQSLYDDPASVVRLDRDPLAPAEPPSIEDLTRDGWHTERRRVPGCWEDWGWSKRIEGPVWLICDFEWPETGFPTIITFGAVSYACHVWLNGSLLGTHRGIWDRFELDATRFVGRGANRLCVEVFKPWEHFFPTKSTLAGFIPYVTCTFGGIWKQVTVRRVPAVRIRDVYAYSGPEDGLLHLEVELASILKGNAEVPIEVQLEGEVYPFTAEITPGVSTWNGTVPLSDRSTWAPSTPVLHEVTVVVGSEGQVDRHTLNYGIRYLGSRGRQLVLNGVPVYPRGILHWMAYVDGSAPVWRPDRHIAEMNYLREMGFNLVKHCLVIPPEEYLDYADRTGMLIWIELPMWLPRVDDDFRRQAFVEYTAIVKQIRRHPCIVIWTLGCELNAQADADFLLSLFRTVKELIPGSPLLRDNSGSAEAYGGVELEISDFYDYHFYAEANQFPGLIDHFLPGWRDPKPLLFGEYCDSDTLRNVNAIQERSEKPLWWTMTDDDQNPQGVRWDMSARGQPAKAKALSLPYPWERSIALSRRKSLDYRKFIIETTRLDTRVSGYVITNIIDTSISTAGVYEVSGEPKYRPSDFAPFNADTVLCLERQRRRVWKRGGDRPRHIDQRNVFQGQEARFRVVAACFGSEATKGELRLVVTDGADGSSVAGADVRLAAVTTPFEATPGQIRMAGEISFEAPVREEVSVLTISAELVGDRGTVATNSWQLWAFPGAPAWKDVAVEVLDVAASGGESLLSKLGKAAVSAKPNTESPERKTLLGTKLDEQVVRRFRSGERVVIVIEKPAAAWTIACPFWREGVPLIVHSSVFSRLPAEGFAGIHFLAVTPDFALHCDTVNDIVGEEGSSLIYRVDARTLAESSYWMEWRSGAGRLIVTTLPLLGGGQSLPEGVDDNVIGSYLLKHALLGTD